MSESEPVKQHTYYITKKMVCPECNGRGFLQYGLTLHDQTNKDRRGEGPCVCASCDGVGMIKIDVLFRDALLQTLDELNEKH